MTATLLLLSSCLGAPLGLTGWTFSNGPEFAGAKGGLQLDGNHLVLSYDFRGGGAYVSATHSFEPAEVHHVALRLTKPAEAVLTFRVVDASGQSLQKSLTYASDDWQRVEVLNGGWTGWWGGANDGQVHGALKSFAILVESRGLQLKTGCVELAEAEVVTGRATAGNGVVRSTYQASTLSAADGWGGGSGKLNGGAWQYQLRPDTRSVWAGNSVSLFGKPQAITVKARGGVAGQRLLLRLGSHFQAFERQLGVLTGGAVAFTVPVPPTGWRWFGGENDGKIHPPLRLAGLGIEGDEPAPAASLHDVTFEVTTDVRRIEGVVLVPQVRQPDGGFAWCCRVVNLLPEAITGQLSVRESDWNRVPGNRDQLELELPPGSNRVVQVGAGPVPLPSQAAVFGEFEFAGEGIRVQVEASAVTTIPATVPKTTEPDSPWGMGLYLYRYANTPESLREMDRAAQLARYAGVKWSREEFQWHRLEPSKGQYDWSYYDAMLDTAQRHGISVYGLLAYWSGWTKPYTPEGIEDYCRWVKAVVGRYHDRVKHWEVWNEPNIFFWSGPKELYPVLLTKAYAAIKATDPTAQVLGCSTAGIDLAFIKRVVAAGAPFDVLTVHPYRGTLNEQTFVDELRQASAAAGGKPVWITEMGWPTHQGGGVSEREQAALLARCYLSAVGSGAVPNMSWYDYRDDGTDPRYNEACFGVVRRDFSPKPAYCALQTICTRLPGAHHGHQLDLGEGLHAFSYETTRGPAVALWSDGLRVVSLALPAGATACDLMGRSAVHRLGGQTVLALLPATPVVVNGVAQLDTLRLFFRADVRAGAQAGQQALVHLELGPGATAPVHFELSGIPGDFDGPRLTDELAAVVAGAAVKVSPRTPAGPAIWRVDLGTGAERLTLPLSLEVLPEVIRG